jgi:hypothetical protein
MIIWEWEWDKHNTNLSMCVGKIPKKKRGIIEYMALKVVPIANANCQLTLHP